MNEVSKVKRINRVKPLPSIFPARRRVALSEGNGSQRSTATTHNGGERRNQHNERDGHSHSRQRIGSDARYVSDVNTVYNAVKQIDKLCCHRRQRHLENQRQHTLRAQRSSYLLVMIGQSLLLFS